jgi:hypothetical protein
MGVGRKRLRDEPAAGRLIAVSFDGTLDNDGNHGRVRSAMTTQPAAPRSITVKSSRMMRVVRRSLAA